MPGWQALQEELAADNFQVIAVAIDEDVEKVRGAADGITYPVLIDADHVVTELYAISNVPTVVMIDEDDTIVHPNWSAFASDTFREITGLDSARQLDRIRRWVRDDELHMSAEEVKSAVDDLTPDEERARLHFRIAANLRRAGDPDGAARNFDRAAELAPHDWTIRRAALPLQGKDPFGDNYFALAAEFNEAGRPYHGVTGH
ncbi:MAG: redoxin domain-containing protein [Ilumatobacter sp.]|nr:redoxin domain-containing protein [Ilumatobacter sp.]